MMRYRILTNLGAVGLHAIAVMLSAALLIVLLPNWWGPLVGHWLQVPTTPELTAESDVVAVLGGDTQLRAEQAVGLLKNILKNKPNAQLLITGDVPDQQIPDWRFAELAEQYAVAQGIPARSITLLASSSTAEDAQKIADYVSQSKLHGLTVVTDWSHSRRAVCQIMQAFGTYNADVTASTLSMAYSPVNWWNSAEGRSAVSLELIKNVYYAVHYGLPVWQCLPTDFNLGGFLVILLGGGLLSFIIAVRLRAIQYQPSDTLDRWPRQPKPCHGGSGLILATFSLLIVSFLTGLDLPLLLGIVYIALGSIMSVLTWLNERHSISSSIWVMALLILAAILVISVGPITLLAVPIVGIATIGVLIGGVVTTLWVAELTVAFTSLEKAEGLVATQAFFAGAVWMILMLTQGQTTLATLSGLLTAASLGLLLLNAPPARILIGKPGSAFCGFTLATLPLLAFHQTQDARWFGVGVLLVAPVLFENGFMLIERVLRRTPYPLYQRLLDIGYPSLIVPTLYGLLAIISDFSAFVYFAGTPIWTLLSLALTVGMMLAVVAWIAVRSAHYSNLHATLATLT